MITDNMIDDASAKYWCLVNSSQIMKAVTVVKTASKDDSDEKTGIQTAIAIGPDKEKLDDALLSESLLTEGFLSFVKDLLMAPPAWVEEPTGVIPVSPKDVFKDDVAGGIEGYNKGCKLAGATAAIATTAAVPSLRTAALKVGKFATKAAVKHPVAATVAASAAMNPDATKKVTQTIVDLTKNGKKEADFLKKMYDKLKHPISKICAFFEPVAKVMMKHPVTSAAVGALCYGLVATRHMWIPYMKRMKYGITAGERLAAVKFNADSTDYIFEYRLKSKRWILLNGIKIADVNDTISFVNTQFAHKFFTQCKKNFDVLFANKDIVLSQVVLMHDDDLLDQMNMIFANEDVIRNTMMKQKISS